MLRVRAHIRDRGLVAILLVDARELAAVTRLDALDVDRALALLAAVAARAVELAVVPERSRVSLGYGEKGSEGLGVGKGKHTWRRS